MSQIIDIHSHAHLLAYAIVSIIEDSESLPGDLNDWQNVAEWLSAASGIVNVEVDTAQFNFAVQYCAGVWEYESSHSEILSQFTTQLTTFSLIWGGFETFIKRILHLTKVPKSMKKHTQRVDQAAYYLASNPAFEIPIPGYWDTLADLSLQIQSHPALAIHKDKLVLKPYCGLQGLGIDIVRHIRNDLAHGSARMPRPDGWGMFDTNEMVQLQSETIKSCSRMVLITMQMLLLSLVSTGSLQYRLEWSRALSIWTENSDKCEPTLNLEVFLRTIHIQAETPAEGQLALFSA